MIFGKSIVLVATLTAFLLGTTSARTCMTCVSTGGSWNRQTNSCGAAGSTTISTGRDCYLNNLLPSIAVNFDYDQNTDWSRLANVPVSWASGDLIRDFYLSYTNLMEESIQFKMLCTGSSVSAYSYTGSVPSNVNMVPFDCSSNTYTVPGNSAGGISLVCPTGSCSVVFSAVKSSSSGALSSVGINLAAVTLGLTAIAVAL